MLKRFSLLAVLCGISILSSGFAAETSNSVGIVNFKECLDQSSLGKKEQKYLEDLRTKMSSTFNDKEKALSDLYSNLSDQEYMEGLSPSAKKELQDKFQALSEDMNQLQYENSQIATQSQFKVLQTMDDSVKSAAQKVATSKSLSLVVNKDTCFFYSPELDITQAVIAEMNLSYDSADSSSTEEADKANS